MKIKNIKAKTKNFFSVVLNDPRRKSLALMSYEFLKFVLTDKQVAVQYFTKFMYRKGMNNFYDYILNEEDEQKCWRLNSPVYGSILDNKYVFEQFFGQKKLRVVKSFAYNLNSLFFAGDKILQINSPDEFSKFLKSLLTDASETNCIFVKKKEASCGGKGVYKIVLADLDSNREKIENLFREVISSSFLFQELVIQHEQINKIYPYCLNTIRIDTYTNKQGISKIMSAFIRVGVNDAIVDNISSGGVYVGINPVKGTLYSEAFSDFSHGGAKSMTAHPVTNCTFEGFQIPFFEEAKTLAIKAAEHINQLKIIGWDVAITPEGPILIEGNDTPGIRFSEVSQYGFKNNPVFSELFAEMKDSTN